MKDSQYERIVPLGIRYLRHNTRVKNLITDSDIYIDSPGLRRFGCISKTYCVYDYSRNKVFSHQHSSKFYPHLLVRISEAVWKAFIITLSRMFKGNNRFLTFATFHRSKLW
jgi:hypothetical protein